MIEGILDPGRMIRFAKEIRVQFFKHFLDTTVMSAILAINFHSMDLCRYVRYASYREGLLKVARERRNLLPLLPLINPEQWTRDDLFSRKLWVKGQRKSTPLDRSPVRGDARFTQYNPVEPARPLRRLKSFESQESWNWLSKASMVIIREWVEYRAEPSVITNLARAKLSVKAPVYAYVIVLRESQRLSRYGVSSAIQLVLRTFLAHCAELWRNEGLKAMRGWLQHSLDARISNVLDYLDEEGFNSGLPNKKSTWKSLVRRSNEWHEWIAIEALHKELAHGNTLTWSSLLPETRIGDIVFTPLVNSYEMAKEGFHMHHCVARYSQDCHNNLYRVFSAKEFDGTRSTLGFSIEDGQVFWDQHEGKYREAVSAKVQLAGRALIKRYQKALNRQRGL